MIRQSVRDLVRVRATSAAVTVALSDGHDEVPIQSWDSADDLHLAAAVRVAERVRIIIENAMRKGE